jgi:DNA-binding NtrC family response regulator
MPVETILVVDDVAAELGAVISVLRSADFHVLEADGATAAIELATTYEGSIELLLADLKMQLLSGRNLVNEMKKSRPNIHMMFISPITGGDLLVFNRQWLLIEKVSVPSKLLEIVSNVLRSSDTLPASSPYETKRNNEGATMHYKSYPTRKQRPA